MNQGLLNALMTGIVFVLIAIIAWKTIYKSAPKLKNDEKNKNEEMGDIAFILDFLARKMKDFTHVDDIKKKPHIFEEKSEEAAARVYKSAYQLGKKHALRRAQKTISKEDIENASNTYKEYYKGIDPNIIGIPIDPAIYTEDKTLTNDSDG